MTGIDLKKTVLGVSIVAVASKILGFVREMVIAERFGTSAAYDTYLLGISVPIFFNLVIVRSVNYLTVPFLTRKLILAEENNHTANIWPFFNSLLALVLMIISLIFIFAPGLVRIVAPELIDESLKQAVVYCRLIAIILLLGFLESFFRSWLNVRKQFAYPMAGNIVLNVIMISTIYIFSGSLSVTSILVGLLVGSAIQVIFLGLKISNINIIKNFGWGLFNREVRQVLLIGSAIVAVEILGNTYFLIDRYYASGMTIGVVAALNYCSLLVMLPVTIIGLAIASVTFPYLSEQADEHQKQEFSRLLKAALALSLTIGIPMGAFYYSFAKDLTAAVYFRGAFDLNSLNVTSQILIYLVPYLISLFIFTILILACYAAGLQNRVMIIGIIAVILKYITTGLLVRVMGYAGIPAATSFIQVVVVTSMATILWTENKLQGIATLLITIVKLVLASMPIIILGLYYTGFPDYSASISIFEKLRIVPAIFISLMGFLTLGYILKIDMVRDIIALGRKAVK